MLARPMVASARTKGSKDGVSEAARVEWRQYELNRL
jgi:hypothetical protein